MIIRKIEVPSMAFESKYVYGKVNGGKKGCTVKIYRNIKI